MITENELKEMNRLMKSLEEDVREMEHINLKLKDIHLKKQKLAEFYEKKWMEYYNNADDFVQEKLEILNQDSLWNALADTDREAREMIRNAAAMI